MVIFTDEQTQKILSELYDLALKQGGLNNLNLINDLIKSTVVMEVTQDKIDLINQVINDKYKPCSCDLEKSCDVEDIQPKEEN